MKKFRKGPVITSLNTLDLILRDREYIYYRGVPKHPAIIQHMNYETVSGMLARGALQEAVRK